MANIIVQNATDDPVALPAPFSRTILSRETHMFVGISEGAVLSSAEFTALVDAKTVLVRSDDGNFLLKLQPPAAADPFQYEAGGGNNLNLRTAKLELDVNRSGPVSRMLQQFRNSIAATFNRLTADSEAWHTAIGSGLSGSMAFDVPGGLTREVSAAMLNAAPAGTATCGFAVVFQCEMHPPTDMLWASFPLTLTPGITTGGAAGAPTLAGGVLNQGRAFMTATYDTDAGVTKTYSPGDSVTIKVQVNAGDELFGYAVAFVTITCNVVA